MGPVSPLKLTRPVFNTVEIRLLDDNHCFACGKDNPHGLQLKFEAVAGGGARAFFTPLKGHQGYKDITHGGILTTILDEAMAQAAIFAGHFAVTAEITVRFRKTLEVGEPARVEAKATPPRRGLVVAEASIFSERDGSLIADAHCKLIAQESH
ncbi:MAG: PaaI family thioesterase [Nitrospiraceae bacterium]|nr:PaaI family thioesterase [Nitrospiraceae bacterium]